MVSKRNWKNEHPLEGRITFSKKPTPDRGHKSKFTTKEILEVLREEIQDRPGINGGQYSSNKLVHEWYLSDRWPSYFFSLRETDPDPPKLELKPCQD